MGRDKIKECLLPYLTKHFGISEIHWYTNLSSSQTIEKLDLATARSMKFDRLNAKNNDHKGLNLQVVINIGRSCTEGTTTYDYKNKRWMDITPKAIT